MLKKIMTFWRTGRTGISLVNKARIFGIWKNVGKPRGKKAAFHAFEKECKRLKRARRIAVFRRFVRTAAKETKFVGRVISMLRKRYY